MDDNYLKIELLERLRNDPNILDFIQRGSLDGVWYWNLENTEDEWMSSKFWETLGYDPKTKTHHAHEWQSIIFDEDKEIALKEMKKHIENPDYPYDVVVRYKHKNGSTVWIRCRGIAIHDENAKAVRMLGSHIDITDIKQNDEDFARLKEEYETVFNGTQDAMFLMEVLETGGFRFIRSNFSHESQTGITQTMLEGKTPQELIGKEAGDLVSLNYQRCVDQKSVVRYEEVLDLPGGKRTWYTILSPIIEDDKVINIVGSARDITDRKLLEQELEYKANYDALTGLSTRYYFYTKLQESIKLVNQRKCQFSLAVIDLNKFKEVNDFYGHNTGDKVLKEIALRIKNTIGSNDVPARLGGDEFAVIIYSNKAIMKTAETLVEALKEAIAKPIHVGKETHQITASIGLAHSPQHGFDYEALINYADKAMYDDKNHKK